ncbi:hypothetical protein [Lusitaniella coriacea]|uniref:hypothetical protein n=1 Tax=Lusitaniella coriacea TaxID=1983105 RepID=UPI003CF6EA69
MSQLKSNLINLLLILCSFSVALILSEGVLRLIDRPPLQVAGWKFSQSESEENQLGFRGNPIKYSPDDFVIILLGDSHVEAGACIYDRMPERRLEHHLNTLGKKVKVFSVGAWGYGQDQQLLALREYYQQYRADLVILWQTPENDIWNNMFPTHWPANGTPKPTFWLEGNQLQGPNYKIGDKIPSSRLGLLLHRVLKSSPKRDDAWEKRLPSSYVPLTDYQGTVNQEWQQRWNSDLGFMKAENLASEKSHLSIFLSPQSPRMNYGITLTRKLIKAIESEVIENQGKLLIFRPQKPSKDRLLGEQIFVLNDKYYRASQEQFQETIEEINQGFQEVLIPIGIEDYRVSLEDGHLNQNAVDVVMKDLALELANTVRDRAPDF